MIIESLFENIENVKAGIKRACERCGRDPREITLIAVSKGVPGPHIKLAQAAGLNIFAENRVQEARLKIESLGHQLQWHLIGHLQKNKAAQALALRFELIQSVDSVELADKLDATAQNYGGRQKILLEINIAAEPQKTGFLVSQIEEVYKSLLRRSHLLVEGIMCMGPQIQPPEAVRPYYQKAKQIFTKLELIDPRIKTLSMGMSHDFEIAIEEASTMVRIGTAIFGPRHQK